MQYLMVLLLILGIIVLMVAIVMGISYGSGRLLHSRDCVRVDSSSNDPCAQCQADRDWYEELPIWQQNVVTVWWLLNRYTCSVKGCK